MLQDNLRILNKRFGTNQYFIMNEIKVSDIIGNIERYKYIFVFEDEFIDDKSEGEDSNSTVAYRSTLAQKIARKSIKKTNNKTYPEDGQNYKNYIQVSYINKYEPIKCQNINITPEYRIDISKHNIVKVEEIQKHKQQFGMDYVFKLVYVPTMADIKSEMLINEDDGKDKKNQPATQKMEKQVIIGTNSKESYKLFVKNFETKKAELAEKNKRSKNEEEKIDLGFGDEPGFF